jgi:hypothetical protein
MPEAATLCAYTDGLVERRGESISTGIDRLCRSLVQAHGTVPEILDSLLHSLVPNGSEDDVALVAVQWQI